MTPASTAFPVAVARPKMSAAVTIAISRVAQAEGLPAAWLKDRAAAFVPVGLLSGECVELLREGPLVWLEPPARVVPLVKVNALRSRGQDLADAKALWPLSGYSTTSESLNAYFEAYPAEEPQSDPVLLPWLAAQLDVPL